jgi:hypothetical protein
MILQYYDDSKRSLVDKIRIALDTCRRNHNAKPDLIMVRQEDRGDLKSVDGIPVEVSSSGMVLRAGYFEFRMSEAESATGPAKFESLLNEVYQQSLF